MDSFSFSKWSKGSKQNYCHLNEDSQPCFLLGVTDRPHSFAASLREGELREFISLQPFRSGNRHAFHFPANPTLLQQGKKLASLPHLFLSYCHHPASLRKNKTKKKEKNQTNKNKKAGHKNEFTLELIAFQKSLI